MLDSRVSWVAELDDGPSRVLAHRYPHAPNLRDVTQVDWSAVEPVDVITGGSPCQDLSHAGKRAGMKDGTRSGLWAAMCDAVETIRPSLVIWENVRGALSAEAAAGDVESCEFCVGDPGEPPLRALGRVLGDLAELGYDAGWCGLRAADVGAPHGRWRVFVVAWPADAEGDRLEAWRRGCGAGEEVAGADGRVGALPAWGSREWRDLTLMPSPRTSDTNGAGAHGTGGLDLRTAVSLLPTPRATDGSKGGPNQHGSSGDLMLPSAVTLMPTPRATRGGSGTETMYGLGAERTDETRTQGVVHLPEGGARFGDYAPAIARWEAVLGRPAPDPTEPSGKDGTHRLSPRFVEFMMGLPSGWVTDPAIWEGMKPSTARNAQLKALGNGVVPQQAAAAIRHMLVARASSLKEAA